MPFEFALRHLDWGTLYVASEWVIRIGALFYVPQRRPPSAARAWLLLIFFLPWAGLLLYLLIGRAYMPRRRLEVQRQIYELIRRIAPRAASFDATVADAVSPELLPALRLADQLSEFPVVGGNRFELLPVYDAAIDRIIAEVNGAQRYVHMLFYIFEDDDVGRRVAEALRAGGAARRRGARADGCDRLARRLEGTRARIARRGRRGHCRDAACASGDRTPRASTCATIARSWSSTAPARSSARRTSSARTPIAGMVNEEMLVRAEGPIVRHLHAVLLGDRYLETGDLPPESDDLSPAKPNATTQGLAEVVPSGPGYNEGTAEAVMIALMYGARSRVVLTSPYVIPSEPFLVAMCSTARRGVTVDLIVDQESNKPLVQLAQQSYYDTMLKAGVNIHRHTGSFLHAKHMSVDDDVALIGSSNLDIRSFALNAEVSVLIYDRTVVADLRRIQDGYLQHTSHVTPEERARVSGCRGARWRTWRGLPIRCCSELAPSVHADRTRRVRDTALRQREAAAPSRVLIDELHELIEATPRRRARFRQHKAVEFLQRRRIVVLVADGVEDGLACRRHACASCRCGMTRLRTPARCAKAAYLIPQDLPVVRIGVAQQVQVKGGTHQRADQRDATEDADAGYGRRIPPPRARAPRKPRKT